MVLWKPVDYLVRVLVQGEEQFILGSEGIFGIITEAWMRLQDIPTYKKTMTISFPNWNQAVDACRALSQSGLYPTNARIN